MQNKGRSGGGLGRGKPLGAHASSSAEKAQHGEMLSRWETNTRHSRATRGGNKWRCAHLGQCGWQDLTSDDVKQATRPWKTKWDPMLHAREAGLKRPGNMAGRQEKLKQHLLAPRRRTCCRSSPCMVEPWPCAPPAPTNSSVRPWSKMLYEKSGSGC